MFITPKYLKNNVDTNYYQPIMIAKLEFIAKKIKKLTANKLDKSDWKRKLTLRTLNMEHCKRSSRRRMCWTCFVAHRVYSPDRN
jgi:hypothetical protein